MEHSVVARDLDACAARVEHDGEIGHVEVVVRDEDGNV